MESQRFTDVELKSLAADGYVIRERVFDAAEVDDIIAECEAVVRRVVAENTADRRHVGSYTFSTDLVAGTTIKWEGDTDIVHGLEPLAHLSEPLSALCLDPRFVEPMIDLVGDDAPMLFTEKLNLKRPRHGGINPLHQDMPYWSFTEDATRIATAMLFLDDSDRSNGTLEVVPGSHVDGLWPNRKDADAFGQLEIDPALGEGLQTVAVEVPAGSVVFFGATLVHRSSPNTSDRERRSLLLSYQPAGWQHMSEYGRKRKR